MILQGIFLALLLGAALLFYRNTNAIFRNIRMGKELDIKDNKPTRWKLMLKVAIGQSKLSKKPIAGILHIIVYIGFILVNVEMIEILYDGLIGSHRILSFLPFYNMLISLLEVLASLVIIVCIVFLIRRNILNIRRFQSIELTRWPRLDANIILCTEIVLMLAFLIMNTADSLVQPFKMQGSTINGTYLISSILTPALSSFNLEKLMIIERTGWWIHILGVFAFLNYIPYSKHFHILLAFPNVYYSKLKPLSHILNMESVTREVKIAMGILIDNGDISTDQTVFGAKDVKDLSWKVLMDAYSCTECGRCTIVCPANLTGKKLSPRKIVMDTRDRIEELGSFVKKKGLNFSDGKMLLDNYISMEEIWACTTCNACTYECPVNIDPLAIIIELRRYVFMEKATAPALLNAMSVNIENNGAPWQYSVADRLNWASNLELNR